MNSSIFKRVFGRNSYFIAILFFTFCSSQFAYADINNKREDDFWEYHPSETSIFEVRFPQKYKQRISPLRLNKKQIVYNAEIVGTIGDDPDPLNNKTYMVKIDQTFGPAIPEEYLQSLLKREAATYIYSMEKQGGILHFEEDINQNGNIGRELIFTYDEEGKKQGLRLKLVFTDSSRIQQIMTGPAGAVQSYKTNVFFDSLKVYPGIAKKDGDITKEWTKHESPHGIYTLYLPPEPNSFIVKNFSYKVSDNIERGHIVFKDPMLSYKTTYDIYGYVFDKKLYTEDIVSLLYSKHIAKYSTNLTRADLKIETKVFPDRRISYAKLVIPPPPKQSYATTIYLQAIYRNNFVVVQEIRGDPNYVTSDLMQTISSNIEFHPDQAHDYDGTHLDSIEAGEGDDDDDEEENVSSHMKPKAEATAAPENTEGKSEVNAATANKEDTAPKAAE